MFRTIKLKIPYDNSILETAKLYRKACQVVLDAGFEEKTYNKNKLNRKTYSAVREEFPTLKSALVQTARDLASEMLKRTKLKKRAVKRSLTMRYDGRTFKFFPDSHVIALTTVMGRLKFPVKQSPMVDKWRGKYTNAQVIIRENRKEMYVYVQVEVTRPIRARSVFDDAIGIDLGIKNIAVLSDNTFFSSGRLRSVKGKYSYLRKRLQHAGTRPARRKLRELSGRERRFVSDVNHRLSKEIANLLFQVFAVEGLNVKGMKKKGNGRKFNGKLGSWSPAQLVGLLKYKAEERGKTVVEIDPRYTSQTCSRCGFKAKNNRNGSEFSCKNCGFELHADLNAARNIGILGRSEYLGLLSTSRSSPALEGKPTISMVGS